MIQTTDTLPCILIREARTPGAWGKGKTAAEAAKSIRANGARNGAICYVFATSADGRITDMGDGEYSARGPIYKGKLHNTGVAITATYDPEGKA